PGDQRGARRPRRHRQEPGQPGPRRARPTGPRARGAGMTTVHGLPLGAESPDDFLVPYVNGSLPPAEGEVVERWLADHPECRARAAACGAVQTAVRRSLSAAEPPDIASLSGLWASIDNTPQPRPLRSPLPPPPPPLDPTAMAVAPRRRSPRWLAPVA